MNKKTLNSFYTALVQENPLQIAGVINAYVALMAKKMGFKAIYLSGAGVANSSYGLPDLGLTTLDNVLEDVRRIRGAVDLPLLVDIDTGWGNSLMIARTIKEMISAGASAIHIEDQVSAKRCGHRPGKQLVDQQEMVDRIKSAVDARTDPLFVIMARTDAFSVEGLDKALTRAEAYKNAGADMVFPEALTDLKQYKAFKDRLGIPILANMTEFGKTPLYSIEELKKAEVDLVLYPLSANRAMNQAAFHVLKEIRSKGSQKDVVGMMQSRDVLYDFLNYKDFEEQLDRLFGEKDGSR